MAGLLWRLMLAESGRFDLNELWELATTGARAGSPTSRRSHPRRLLLDLRIFAVPVTRSR